MEKKKKKTRRLWRLTLLALLLLIAAAAALMYLVGSRGLSADADDPDVLLSNYDPESFSGVTLREDGTLELGLGKADLYWFARKYALTEPIRQWLSSDPRLLNAGFRLSGESLTISIRRKAGGLLPLSYRVEAGVLLRGTELSLEVREVKLGSRIPLRKNQWPALFRQPPRVDLSGTDFAAELLTAQLRGGELWLRLRGLTGQQPETLSPDERSVAALRLFGLSSGAIPASTLDSPISAEALCALAVASGHPRSFLAEAMSLCRQEDLPLLWKNSSAIARRWLWDDLHREAEERRGELESALTERQIPYEKLLLALRELYRSGSLGIGETGFYNPATGEAVHPGTLSRLNVTAIDSRLVFLLTGMGEAAVEEMPPMLTVPRKNWLTMDDDLDWKVPVDLGVLLTTEGEVPILLYRRSDGTLMLREVSEELYVSAMVSRPIPQIDLDTLPEVREYPRRAGEGFSGAVIGFLEK